LLLVAALSRVLIAFGDAPALSLPEPVLGIPLRYAVLAVGGIELAVALTCVFGRRIGLQIGWLTWLGTGYVVFWIGLVCQHFSPQGSCIGSLTDPLLLHQGTTGYIFALMPFGLILGSYATAGTYWLAPKARTARSAEAREHTARRDAASGLIRMTCPACGGHVKFASQNLGQQIPCPHCQAAILLSNPEEYFKMTCVLCNGHVEFPPHALGHKIPCPHCAKTITLLRRN
jgi:DNA-directed RNA polymerase subunit RPC12/RpoP